MSTRRHPRKAPGVKAIVMALAMAAAQVPSTAQAVKDEEVTAAMESMRKWLHSQQGNDGGWDAGVAGHEASQATGRSALVLDALLRAGDHEKTPAVARGLRYLEARPSEGTYAVALRARVFAQLPLDRFEPHLNREADWLLRSHRGSLFDYGPGPRQDRIDHSVSQFGIMGLWEYEKAGGPVMRKFWEDAADHFIEAQKPDGGWDYNTQGGSTGSMTAAGLTVLHIAQQQAFRQNHLPDPEITTAIQGGLLYLQRNFNGGKNPGGGWNFYYLCGIERVARFSGVRYFNGQDCYEAGAEYILAKQQPNGSIGGSVVDTAFALAFLARARAPVWVSKIAIPNADWNNRPNDLYFATEYLADEFEKPLAWQTIHIEAPLEHWRTAPVAYISTRQPLQLNAPQKDAIKAYIEHGGTMLFNSEGGRGVAADSFAALMRELYPNAVIDGVDDDHPLMNAHLKLTRVALPDLVTAWTVIDNGRTIAIIWSRDFGRSLQMDDPPQPQTAPWAALTNFYVIASKRNTLENRFVVAEALRKEHDAAGEDVAREAE